MIGNFIIKKIIDEIRVEAVSEYNENIIVTLYLQPLNRQDTSEISTNDKVFAIVDDTSGIGCVLINLTHDFSHKFDYDINIQGSLYASSKVKSGGDVVATGSLTGVEYTLLDHTHTAGELMAGETPVIGSTAPTEVI